MIRINKFLAQATGLSRRAADDVISRGLVRVNQQPTQIGQMVDIGDTLSYDGKTYRVEETMAAPTKTILFHKPIGYVVSRDGQGNPTIYDILPPEYQLLKPVGRLDMYSSGLLLLTNDGELANRLTHPSYQKVKIYQIQLTKDLAPLHRQMINDHGIQLDDGISQLQIERLNEGDDQRWQITMHQGRNRQIRRTFAALGYHVNGLHRIQFGEYQLGDLAVNQCRPV